ncbi:hypothetical protein D3C75_555770 [compost metagenome]
MLAVGTNNRNIVRDRAYCFVILVVKCQFTILFTGFNMSPEPDFHLFVFPAHFPHIIILQPIVRQFHLVTVHNLLLKQAVFVADAAAMPRILQGSQGIQEAGCQPAKAAIAKPCIRFFLLHLPQIESKLRKAIAHNLKHTHIQQIIAKQPADQKLH